MIVRKEKIYGRVLRERKPSGLAKKYTEMYNIYMHIYKYTEIYNIYI